MDWEFSAPVWHWRGPSPYHFVSVPDDVADDLREAAPMVSYGWGVIPVSARIGATSWTTSLFPRDGGYAVPLKDRVRRAESVGVGDTVTVGLTLAPPR